MGVKYQLSVIAKGDTRDASNALRRLEQRAERTSSRVRGASLRMGKAAAAGASLVAVAAAGASAKMVTLASDATETQGKLEVTFGKTLPGLTRQLDEFSKATGASRYTLREQAATIGALLKPMNLGADATADMSVKVTQLATDLSSFNNVPVDDALASLKSGLTGETEPLKKFGILMNEAAIEAEAARLGLEKQGKTYTEQQKVQARYSLILSQTKDAQGDAERTAGSLANRMRALQNRVKDTATDLGQKLQPAALRMVNAGMRLIDWLSKAVQKGGALRPMIDGMRTGLDRLKSAVTAAGSAFVSGFNGPTGQSAGSARDVAAAIGAFSARAGELAQKYLPPLAEVLGRVSRFLFDNRKAVLAVVVGAAALDRGIKAVRLTLTAYGVAARAATKVTQLYRLAKWQLAAAEVRQRVATLASTAATKAQAVASRAAAIATRLLNVAMRANPVGLVITGILLLGTALVAAYKKSDRFRSIVQKVWDWMKRAASRVLEFKEYLLLLAGPAGALALAYKKSDRFRSIVHKIVDRLKAVGSTIKDTVLDTITKLRKAFDKLLDKLKPVADTLGKIGGALGKVGSLGGKAASALPGIGDALIPGMDVAPGSVLRRWGLQPKMGLAVGLGMANGLKVTSGIRPGAITAAGLPSDHGTGSAVDLAGPPNLMARVYQLAGFLPGLKQRIYSPLDGWSDDHYDHVHLAMHAKGGRLGAHGAGCNCGIHKLSRVGGRLTKPTVVDIAGEAGAEQIVPLSREYRRHGLRNLHEAARSLGVSIVEHAKGGKAGKAVPKPATKPAAKPKKKPLTPAQRLQNRFDASQTKASRTATALDLQTAQVGESPAQLEKLRKNSMAEYNRLRTFLSKNSRKMTAEMRANVQGAMAEHLRAAQGYAGQIADINQQAADAADAAAQAAGEAAAQAAQDAADAAQAAADAAQAAFDQWRGQWSNRATMLDLALAQAEATEGTADDAAALSQLAANARDEYNNLLAKMQDGTLSETARLELASGAAGALRQAMQYEQQVKDMAAETATDTARQLSDNERRGLSLLGIKTQPGATQVTVAQYFTQEPNMFAASKGIQWALQGAAG